MIDYFVEARTQLVPRAGAAKGAAICCGGILSDPRSCHIKHTRIEQYDLTGRAIQNRPLDRRIISSAAGVAARRKRRINRTTIRNAAGGHRLTDDVLRWRDRVSPVIAGPGSERRDLRFPLVTTPGPLMIWSIPRAPEKDEVTVSFVPEIDPVNGIAFSPALLQFA